MLVLAGIAAYLLDLRRGDIPRVKTTDAAPLAMHGQHHLNCLLTSHSEKLLQDHHDKLHGSEIVVQQQDLEHRRRLGASLLALEDCRWIIGARHVATTILSSESIDRSTAIPQAHAPYLRLKPADRKPVGDKAGRAANLDWMR